MYETPPLYLASHLLIGVISYFYPLLFLLFIAYQLLQLTLGVRFFLFSWEIKKGNSPIYTYYKIMQTAVGVFLTHLLHPYLRFAL